MNYKTQLSYALSKAISFSALKMGGKVLPSLQRLLHSCFVLQKRTTHYMSLLGFCKTIQGLTRVAVQSQTKNKAAIRESVLQTERHEPKPSTPLVKG